MCSLWQWKCTKERISNIYYYQWLTAFYYTLFLHSLLVDSTASLANASTPLIRTISAWAQIYFLSNSIYAGVMHRSKLSWLIECCTWLVSHSCVIVVKFRHYPNLQMCWVIDSYSDTLIAFCVTNYSFLMKIDNTSTFHIISNHIPIIVQWL